MDIYEYFESKDIAQYCFAAGVTFTPVEMAAIVYRSDKTVAQKHQAYMQIINEYPDMPLPAISEEDFFIEEKPSLHEFLRTIIADENYAIEDFITPKENYFYYPRLLSDQGFKWAFTDFMRESGVYSTIEKAIADFEKLALGSAEEVEWVLVVKHCLDTKNIGEYPPFLCFNMQGEVYNSSTYESQRLEYINIDRKLPPIMLISDKSVKDAVLSKKLKPQWSDFEEVTELELHSPESLYDLSHFRNLERLIINYSPDEFRACILNYIEMERNLKEIILRMNVKGESAS